MAEVGGAKIAQVSQWQCIKCSRRGLKPIQDVNRFISVAKIQTHIVVDKYFDCALHATSSVFLHM
jgi:hypothetical protein